MIPYFNGFVTLNDLAVPTFPQDRCCSWPLHSSRLCVPPAICRGRCAHWVPRRGRYARLSRCGTCGELWRVALGGPSGLDYWGCAEQSTVLLPPHPCGSTPLVHVVRNYMVSVRPVRNNFWHIRNSAEDLRCAGGPHCSWPRYPLSRLPTRVGPVSLATPSYGAHARTWGISARPWVRDALAPL